MSLHPHSKLMKLYIWKSKLCLLGYENCHKGVSNFKSQPQTINPSPNRLQNTTIIIIIIITKCP